MYRPGVLAHLDQRRRQWTLLPAGYIRPHTSSSPVTFSPYHLHRHPPWPPSRSPKSAAVRRGDLTSVRPRGLLEWFGLAVGAGYVGEYPEAIAIRDTDKV